LAEAEHRTPEDERMTAIPLSGPTGPAGGTTGPAESARRDRASAEAIAAFRALARRDRRTMVWRRAFPGVRERARDARRFVRLLLADAPRAEDVVQAAAELVANAVVHTRSGAPGGLYVVELRRWQGGTSLAVADQGGPAEPRAGGGDGEPAEHGYGLRTVSSLATWWGWRGSAARGRTVTAIFMTGGD
jgi:serine/threonine-protein kinase RsbW